MSASTGATHELGMLHIDLVRETPEALKPRRIEIARASDIEAKAVTQTPSSKDATGSYRVRARRRARPFRFYLIRKSKCLRTFSTIFQVPLKSFSTTKASPASTVTGVPPSGVMMILPSIRTTNS